LRKLSKLQLILSWTANVIKANYLLIRHDVLSPAATVADPITHS